MKETISYAYLLLFAASWWSSMLLVVLLVVWWEWEYILLKYKAVYDVM